MTGFNEKVTEAVSFLTKSGVAGAEVAIILGTGLGKLVEHIDLELTFGYGDI
ncbi:MAG: purine-nucleoside phosphorylase, partial [Candidatus Moranbacteria bacterium]|nr:purine-nucleoside phosphorylase [Candidatus Moranbacteria bacterium]